MKKYLLLIAFVIYGLCANAQFIQGFTISPSNPNSNDHLKIMANMSFSSGGCSDHQQFSSIQGTTISASALHCLGALSVICNYSDTFAIGQLAAGNYRFIFSVNEGGGPSPCSPGIVPGPTDSISFTVSQAASISELSEENISITYNALQGKIILHFNKPLTNGKVSLFNLTGQVLHAEALTALSQSLSAKELNAGFYIVEITSDKGHFAKRILVQE